MYPLVGRRIRLYDVRVHILIEALGDVFFSCNSMPKVCVLVWSRINIKFGGYLDYKTIYRKGQTT